MTDFQAAIAEVLAAHWSVSTHTDRKPYVDKCDGCGAVVLTWDTSMDAKDALSAHQAAMLAPIIRDAQAEALREAADDPNVRLSGHSGISIQAVRRRAAQLRPPNA